MANRRIGAIYIGQTSDLITRVWEHQNNIFEGFTQKYDCKRLVWYEIHHDREDAFTRERQLKRWNRAWKVDLIEELNRYWDDLSIRLNEDNLYDESRMFENIETSAPQSHPQLD